MSKGLDVSHDSAKTKIIKRGVKRKRRSFDYNKNLHSEIKDLKKHIGHELIFYSLIIILLTNIN